MVLRRALLSSGFLVLCRLASSGGWGSCYALVDTAAPLSEEEARDLLREVGERYFGLTDFAVEIAATAAAPDMAGLTTNVLVHQGDGDRFYISMKNRWDTWISDGETLWIWRESKREYREMFAEGQELRLVKGMLGRYTGKFERLVRVSDEVRFVGWKSLKRGSQKLLCAGIEIAGAQGTLAAWKETLWIDPASLLVLETLYWRTQGGFRETKYTWLMTGSVADENIFTFRPPRGARKVKEFEGRSRAGYAW
jgi:outer membrane lipoprotein-sorting protein